MGTGIALPNKKKKVTQTPIPQPVLNAVSTPSQPTNPPDFLSQNLASTSPGEQIARDLSPEAQLTAAYKEQAAAKKTVGSTAPEEKQITNPNQYVPVFIVNSKGGIVGLETPEGGTIMGPAEHMKAMANVFSQQLTLPQGSTSNIIQKQQQQALEQQQQQVMQQSGEVNLTPMISAGVGEKLPLLGSSVGAVSVILADLVNKYLSPTIKANVQQPEQLRTAVATEIEKKVYEQGLTASEETGAFIEAIPILGSIADKYARDFIDTPSGKIRDLTLIINQNVKRSDKYRSYAKQGIISPETAVRLIDEIIANNQEMQSKIKLLANHSAIMRANPENLYLVQTKLDRANEALLQNRAAAALGQKGPTDDFMLSIADEDVTTTEKALTAT